MNVPYKWYTIIYSGEQEVLNTIDGKFYVSKKDFFYKKDSIVCLYRCSIAKYNELLQTDHHIKHRFVDKPVISVQDLADDECIFAVARNNFYTIQYESSNVYDQKDIIFSDDARIKKQVDGNFVLSWSFDGNIYITGRFYKYLISEFDNNDILFLICDISGFFFPFEFTLSDCIIDMDNNIIVWTPKISQRTKKKYESIREDKVKIPSVLSRHVNISVEPAIQIYASLPNAVNEKLHGYPQTDKLGLYPKTSAIITAQGSWEAEATPTVFPVRTTYNGYGDNKYTKPYNMNEFQSTYDRSVSFTNVQWQAGPQGPYKVEHGGSNKWWYKAMFGAHKQKPNAADVTINNNRSYGPDDENPSYFGNGLIFQVLLTYDNDKDNKIEFAFHDFDSTGEPVIAPAITKNQNYMYYCRYHLNKSVSGKPDLGQLLITEDNGPLVDGKTTYRFDLSINMGGPEGFEVLRTRGGDMTLLLPQMAASFQLERFGERTENGKVMFTGMIYVHRFYIRLLSQVPFVFNSWHGNWSESNLNDMINPKISGFVDDKKPKGPKQFFPIRDEGLPSCVVYRSSEKISDASWTLGLNDPTPPSKDNCSYRYAGIFPFYMQNDDGTEDGEFQRTFLTLSTRRDYTGNFLAPDDNNFNWIPVYKSLWFTGSFWCRKGNFTGEIDYRLTPEIIKNIKPMYRFEKLKQYMKGSITVYGYVIGDIMSYLSDKYNDIFFDFVNVSFDSVYILPKDCIHNNNQKTNNFSISLKDIEDFLVYSGYNISISEYKKTVSLVEREEILWNSNTTDEDRKYPLLNDIKIKGIPLSRQWKKYSLKNDIFETKIEYKDGFDGEDNTLFGKKTFQSHGIPSQVDNVKTLTIPQVDIMGMLLGHKDAPYCFVFFRSKHIQPFLTVGEEEYFGECNYIITNDHEGIVYVYAKRPYYSSIDRIEYYFYDYIAYSLPAMVRRECPDVLVYKRHESMWGESIFSPFALHPYEHVPNSSMSPWGIAQRIFEIRGLSYVSSVNDNFVYCENTKFRNLLQEKRVMTAIPFSTEVDIYSFPAGKGTREAWMISDSLSPNENSHEIELIVTGNRYDV